MLFQIATRASLVPFVKMVIDQFGYWAPMIIVVYLPWVPEVFFSLGATELSGEAAKSSREAARKKPLAPTDNNLTSMPTPISFD